MFSHHNILTLILFPFIHLFTHSQSHSTAAFLMSDNVKEKKY